MTPILLPAFDLQPSSSTPPIPTLLPSLLPPHVPTPTRHTLRKRHCSDPDCCIWVSPIHDAQRWAAFDAFDPSALEDYGGRVVGERAEQLRNRAKSRLMPRIEPYIRSTNPYVKANRVPQRRRHHRESSPCTPAPTRFASPSFMRAPPTPVTTSIAIPRSPRTPPPVSRRRHTDDIGTSVIDSPTTLTRSRIINLEMPVTPDTVIASSPTPPMEYRVLSPSPIKFGH